jgi:hypothetical protein
VKAAGVRRFGGVVEVLELPRPRGLRPDEVLIDVRVRGVGNWDEFARTGNRDLGTRPPTAPGVEATGLGPERVRVLTGGSADAAANAARADSVEAVRAVRDGGRLATITADRPAAERDITMRAVRVAPDGRRLGRLVQLLAPGSLTVPVLLAAHSYAGARRPAATGSVR